MKNFYKIEYGLGLGLGFGLMGKDLNGNGLWARKNTILSDRGYYNLCKFCIMGRHRRVAFSISQHKTKDLLDLIHTDVWRSSPVASNRGTKYYVTFIDDFSSRVWVYFLKQKIRSILEVHGVKNYGRESKRVKGESFEVR